MNLETISMERGAAREAFRAFRREVALRHDLEDIQLMRGYRFLAEGKQLLQLSGTLREAGVGPDGMPRLAIARAGTQWCYWIGFQNGAGWFNDQRPYRGGRLPAGASRVELPPGTWDSALINRAPRGNLRAMVPIVPASLRPARGLAGLHVLWEAEWEVNPEAPRDPALLKRLGDDLWAVLAVWDLTPLERAVLGARRLALP